MLYVVLLILGFASLIFGANVLVDNASSLAKRLNIPNIVIGLTIVAFGTSAPELTVNAVASFKHNSDLVLGNIIGSNILNILFILGISAIIFPLTIRRNTTWIEIPLCLLSAFVIIVMANDALIDKHETSIISRIDGILLIMFFIIFLAYNINLIKKEKYTEEIVVKDRSVPLSILLIIAGVILLIIGGRLIVHAAISIATTLHISERLIALTIVSIGTSLPELATSVTAAIKRNNDIAIGNIVGSNIFNVFLILGISSCICPISLPPMANFDMVLNIIASLLLFLFIFTGKGRKLERWEGILFILLYLSYILYIFFK